MTLLLIIFILFLFYSFLIFYYWRAWDETPYYIPTEKNTQTRISIIIPARNEEKNISLLLNALEQQTYPSALFEVIVVDDHSTDRTAAEVKKFSFAKLIQLPEQEINSYKKKALETGIAAATGELIVTTDADCVPAKKWLQTIASFKEEKHSVFIAAPVDYNNNQSMLEIFQAMDFLVLQGITGAAVHKGIHSMCNGANLAYEKKVFNEVGGFAGINHIASGDDMLLMHKIRMLYPEKVHYLKSKDAIVSTQPMKTWKSFFNQRIRWASKAKQYQDKKIIAVLLLVYVVNLSFLILTIAGFWQHSLWLYALGLWLAKTLVEIPFVYSVASFFNKKSLLTYFFFFQPLHIIYTVFSGLLGQFGKYEWKGRRVY